MAAAPQTGIKSADDFINLADAFGLTVTLETTDRGTATTHYVRISIPVPPAYAGTELGRAIAGDVLTLTWTKSHRKGARGSLLDATRWTVDSHRKLRNQQSITRHIHSLGNQSARYVRETAPQVEDVVDARHALVIDGELRNASVSVDFVRRVVRNRRHHGRPLHQDTDGAIVIENRRYVPQPAPVAEETAPAAEERQHVRTVNGGTPQLIPTRDALAEINAAMMRPGRRAVREMSEARSHARIVYRDGRTVTLRPATAEDLAAPTARPAAEVLAADPIPADVSVLKGMPGEAIASEGKWLRNARDAMAHQDYVVQLRSRGAWILPNHDDRADITRGGIVNAVCRVLNGAPTRARASIDTDGTVYLSNGYQAARYIPAALIAGHSTDVCPGCGTPYATNGDGPCASVARLEPAGR